VVASPRNQRYLQPVTALRGGPFAARAERQDPGQIVNELDPASGSAVL